MAILFPSLEPVNIAWALGAYSVSRDIAPAGSVTLRQRGSEVTNVPISIDFGTIPDDSAADVLIAWNAASGFYRPLTLPSSLFIAIGTALKASFPTHTQWYFKEVPTFISSMDIPGYTDLSVVLEAEY